MSANSESKRRPTLELQAEPGGDRTRGRAKKAMADRCAAHERWVGSDDDDGACRGID